MQYHIQTAPVWDAYREQGCPLCKIFDAREKRLVEQYLSDNVMDPDFRTASNRIGFCPEHLRMLYAGQNKLGLALQLETRAEFLNNTILKATPTDKKSAKKTAQKLREHTGCVICAALDEITPRYYMTIAQMFANESEFPELFGKAKHCVKHAAHLYEAAEYAGKAAPAYLAALTASLKRELKNTQTELRDFADCFDFRNAGSRPDPDSIPRAIALLSSKQVK